MTIERGVRMLAGTFVLVSVALGAPGSPLHHDPRWLWFTAFIGANLLQSAFTGFCPPTYVLRKLGFSEAPPFDARTAAASRATAAGSAAPRSPT